MPDEPVQNLLPRLSTRREYFDYLDRWTVGTVDNLRAHMTNRALVKAYLLETSRSNGARDAIAALQSARQKVDQVDETLYRLRRLGEGTDWALVEIEDQRYPVVYTALDSQEANRRVNHLLSISALLDRAWFAAPMFQRLWKMTIEAFPEHRFSQMVFEHESLFEALVDDLGPASIGDDDQEDAPDSEDRIEVERRRARMQITERIGILANALAKMRSEYGPLESIIRLRIPAPQRGGHDVYFDGRFTNRSDSMASLHQTVALVTNIYRHITEKAEEASWPKSSDVMATRQPISLGAPLLVKFNEKLEQATFERWIAALKRKNNRFRLWGNPIELSKGKVHLYAVDAHLWQPVDLEITRDHLYALLPSGTCGNTIHRLVANIQRFVYPKLETYIGDQSYEAFIAEAPVNKTSGGSASG